MIEVRVGCFAIIVRTTVVTVTTGPSVVTQVSNDHLLQLIPVKVVCRLASNLSHQINDVLFID
jgi:hypothetical protein